MADPGFLRGGAPTPKGGGQHTILPKFPENCMKLKEFGPQGVVPVPPLDPPMQATFISGKVGTLLWWIQDFREEGKYFSANSRFCQYFPKTVCVSPRDVKSSTEKDGHDIQT